MEFERSSGVLLHVTSLPGPHGIGDLGGEAYDFVDYLVRSGQKLWEILPLNPIGYGNSPYSSPSAFAGNTLLISLERLAKEGLLEIKDLPPRDGTAVSRTRYQQAERYKKECIHRAFLAFRSGKGKKEETKFGDFCHLQRFWLDDYSLFVSLKEHFGGKPWFDWPAGLASRKPSALREWKKKLAVETEEVRVAQYFFWRQWQELRKYANRQGVRIIGDIPLFVNHDSVDVWTNRQYFLLDEQGRPTALSGVPPKPPRRLNQIWGSPLYSWDAMSGDGFAWWSRRFKAILDLVDIVRVDHFSGFYACWQIPPEARTSAEGEWVKGPDASLFRAVEAELGKLPVIAEARERQIYEPVQELIREMGYAPSRIIENAFDGDPGNDNLPDNYPVHCSVCTSTHDDDTILEWYGRLAPEFRRRVRRYLRTENDEEINWKLIRLLYGSVADTVVVPLQDLLGLGSEARMNRPGEATGQWEWRCEPGFLTDQLASRLSHLGRSFGR